MYPQQNSFGLEKTLNQVIYDISIIIPFYKRDEYGKKIFKEINYQSNKENLKIELIFVESNSRIDLEENISKLDNFGNIDVKFYDTEDHVSKKRNFGISKAKSENIIIMDDDCIPSKNFLRNHYLSLVNLNNQKYLMCGLIKYDQYLINKSNYFRFRDEGHRKFDMFYKLSKNLNFHNIVVMNMSFKKKTFQENNLKFNEEFNTYGFEDLQFGIDALFKDFQIKINNAEVIHQDSTPLSIFKKKINSFAKTYFFLFYPYNRDRIENKNDRKKYNILSSNLREYRMLVILSKLNIKYKNKNVIMKILFSFIYFLFSIPSFILEKILTITDKLSFFLLL